MGHVAPAKVAIVQMCLLSYFGSAAIAGRQLPPLLGAASVLLSRQVTSAAFRQPAGKHEVKEWYTGQQKRCRRGVGGTAVQAPATRATATLLCLERSSFSFLTTCHAPAVRREEQLASPATRHGEVRVGTSPPAPKHRGMLSRTCLACPCFPAQEAIFESHHPSQRFLNVLSQYRSVRRGR